MDDGRCLGQRTNFFGHNGLGPCLSVTNIQTFYDLHFAIVSGQSSHFEVINLSSLKRCGATTLVTVMCGYMTLRAFEIAGKDGPVIFFSYSSISVG